MRRISKAPTYADLVKILEDVSLPPLPSLPPEEIMNTSSLFLPIDGISDPLIPDDVPIPYNTLHAAEILPDGNCLSRCMSILAYGSQTMHSELRIRILKEFIDNFHVYINPATWVSDANYLSRLRATSCSPLTDPVEHLEDNIMRMRKDGDYMDIFALKAGSEVIGVPIYSVYPNYAYMVVRQDLHRMLEPMHFRDLKPRFIMWTRTDGVELEPNRWRPNHFTLLLPETRYLIAFITVKR